MRRIGIETRRQRQRLAVGRKPAWVNLGDGLAIGYRRTATGAGTWTFRRADGRSGYRTGRVGLADDLTDADGRDILNYAQAVVRGRKIAAGHADADDKIVITVGDALDSYRAELEAADKSKYNVTRVLRHLPDALAKRPVVALTKSELLSFRERLKGKMRVESANRTMGALKRALEIFANRSDADIDRAAWRVGLARFEIGKRRVNHVALPDAIIAKIVAAARELSPEFGALTQALAETGSRCSQLIRCRIADLDADAAVILIPVSKKGRGIKQVELNELPVSADLAARLKVMAGDRPITAPLFLREDGAAWQHTDETGRFRKAVRAAGQDPAAITSYHLRHSWILGRLKSNVPARIVAQLADTSLEMLQRHYSVSIGQGVSDMMRAALPNVQPAVADVVQLRK